MNRMCLGLVCVFLVLTLAACGTDAGAGTGVGTVLEVDAAAAKVTLEHGDIPGLMKAMTMTFDVADPALLADLEAGDRVDFRVRYAEGKYTVTEIARK